MAKGGARTHRWVALAAIAACLLVGVGSAVAATIRGSGGADVIRGTTKADVLYGLAGNDKIYGLAGNDRIIPGPGKDRVYCGGGVDRVTADAIDVVAKDCEIVSRPPKSTKPTPTPTPKPPVGSTLTNPYPFGATVPVGAGWSMRVVSITPNATDAVLARNQFNDPPAAGNQFFIARVSATFNGTGSDSFDASFRLRAVGAAAVSYSTFENSCGVIPDEISDADVFPGGTIEGNVCWAIRSSDADSLVMYDKPLLANTQTFIALR